MGFGFIVERFGLFLKMLATGPLAEHHRPVSLWLGVLFVLLGAGVAAASTVQFRRVVRRLAAPDLGYWTNLGVVTNLSLCLLGLFMAAYFLSS